MMQTFDPARVAALERLLARPDPSDLPRRAHTLRCLGDPDRRETRLPGIVTCWLQRRHLDAERYEPVAAATRTVIRAGRRPNPGLHVLRPTGTG